MLQSPQNGFGYFIVPHELENQILQVPSKDVLGLSAHNCISNRERYREDIMYLH